MKQERTTGTYTTKYLRKYKISRGPRKPGEVFALDMGRLGIVFGRVIRDACATSPTPNSPPDGPWPLVKEIYLVYIFRDVSDRIDHSPVLSCTKLLLPPKLIIRAGWTHGYFIPVAHKPLGDGEVLPRHCFWREELGPNGRSRRYYVDEFGNRLPGPLGRCAQHAIGSFGSLEEQIAAVLLRKRSK